MIKSIKDYHCEWEDRLNRNIMTKAYDAPFIDYVIDVWKSLEVSPNIEFVGYEYNDHESEIDVTRYIHKREKKKKKKDKHKIKYIADDRVGLLTCHLNITMLEKDPKTGESKYVVYPISKSMLTPIFDDQGYCWIKGKRYYLIYQMVEKSTYTSDASVTLKSGMAVAIKRHSITVDDVDGTCYSLPRYNVFVFKKEVPIILFYLAKGLDYMVDFLNLNGIVDFIPELPEELLRDPTKIYFSISSKCYIEVDRTMFKKYPYIQSIVGSMMYVTSSRVTMEHLYDTKLWIKKVAEPANYVKGLSICRYVGRLLDEGTKKIVKTPEYYKKDIYSLLKWMMQHFNELRLKDNCDLSNKRIRCYEYITQLLNKEFTRRLNRFISMGNKATIESMREVFKFNGDILIRTMYSSGILRFDDAVNDLTFFSKFKFTKIGPTGELKSL